MATLSLTEQDKVDIRRHCGYGFLGEGNHSLMYWRYFRHFNTLEYRLDNLQDEEITLLQDTYLPMLNDLEMQPYSASDNLDTSRAAVWFHNDNEVVDRMELYRNYRVLMCNLMQIPPGPFFSPLNNSVRMTV